MLELEPPDKHLLLAAIGWLELGNASEAEAELSGIQPALREHPAVLGVQWQICAHSQRWDAALEAAEKLVQVAPDQDHGWLHRAYALRRAKCGGLEQAWNALRPAYDRFPKVPIVPYNLACYAAQLGRLEEAFDWFSKSVQVANDLESMRQMALADPDLEPLWERIRQM